MKLSKQSSCSVHLPFSFMCVTGGVWHSGLVWSKGAKTWSPLLEMAKMPCSPPCILVRVFSSSTARVGFRPFWESRDPFELNFWLLESSKLLLSFFFFQVSLSFTLLSLLATAEPPSLFTSCDWIKEMKDESWIRKDHINAMTCKFCGNESKRRPTVL